MATRFTLQALIAAALMLSGVCATAQQASWNGTVDYVTTITGNQGVRCGYTFNGQQFTRVFRASDCPRVVDVEVPQSARRTTLADCEFLSPTLSQQCVRTAPSPSLAECEGISPSLYQLCIQRASGR